MDESTALQMANTGLERLANIDSNIEIIKALITNDAAEVSLPDDSEISLLAEGDETTTEETTTTQTVIIDGMTSENWSDFMGMQYALFLEGVFIIVALLLSLGVQVFQGFWKRA